MKKSILYLSIAFLSFVNVSFANENSQKNSTVSNSVSLLDPTPLCTAISKGETEIVKKFVEYGADVNEKSNGMTPLMIAARYNNVEIVAYLISKGAELNQKSENGFTALKWAEAAKATEVIELLSKASKK